MKEFLSGWIQKIENLPPLYGCILVYRSNVLRVPDQFLREGVKEFQILVAKLVRFTQDIPFLSGTLNCKRKIISKYMEDITRWREDMNFMFKWQEQYIVLAT